MGEPVDCAICAHGSLAKKCDHCHDVRESFYEGFGEGRGAGRFDPFGDVDDESMETAWRDSKAKARCEQ